LATSLKDTSVITSISSIYKILKTMKYLFLTLFLIIQQSLVAQTFDTSLPIDTVLNSVIYLQGRQNDTLEYSGTGFFVRKVNKIDSTKTKIFLITNVHLIPLNNKLYGDSLTLRVYRNKNSKKILDNIVIPIKPNIKFNNKGADIAVIDITSIWQRFKITSSYIDYKYLATDSILKAWDFNIGDEISILGFPNSIYDENNTTPVLRRGVISTNLYTGYHFNKGYQQYYGAPKYLEGFLLDASLFPGSSGSLVLYFPQKLPLPKNMPVMNIGKIDWKYRKSPRILGIISGSLIMNDFDVYPTRIDLGITYSYRAIKETIDQFK
jgi:hypothetical protein